jgi:ATP-dependent Clp protease ATP-binding subunit ClpA
LAETTKSGKILEILSHQECANSVMLLGEAGVGKTAVVEALARRLELEPESVPERLPRLPDRQPADECARGGLDAPRDV